jgi:Protein of unknown function (DUF1573)
MNKLNVIISMVLVALLVACNNTETKNNISTNVVKNSNSANGELKPYTLPKMSFEDTTYDFGRIIQGEKVAYDFKFTNIGRSDLLISKVSTSCGCTVGKYPKYPIKPGGKGKIEVVFDSKSKRGFQNKTITVLANTQPNHTILFLKGVVVEPEKN